jgi:phage major head subunit gpT-like protein
MQINDANLADLYRGYTVLFDAALQGSKPVSDPFLQKVTSTKKQQKYAWLGAVPGMRKLLDEIQIKNLAASTYTITNQEFEDTVAIKQVDIEDDDFGIYNSWFTATGEAASFDQDLRSFPLLLGGFSATSVIDEDGTLSGTDYTGSAFFSTGKIRTPGDPGFSNILATAGNIEANAPLNIYSYRAGRANLMSRLNAAGRPMNLGRNLQLVVGTKLESAAKQILIADTIIQANPGNTSVAAVSNIDKGTAQVITSALIDASATPNAWFLLECGLSLKPLAWQINKPIGLYMLNNMASDHVFKHHEFLLQAYGRYNAGYLLSDLAFGSTGAGTVMTAYP